MTSLERRQWSRFELPIPLFVRGQDVYGRPFTELATTLNLSAGGALVAIRTMVPVPGELIVEIPRAPLPDVSDLPPLAPSSYSAQVIRRESRTKCHLLALQFAQPITKELDSATATSR